MLAVQPHGAVTPRDPGDAGRLAPCPGGLRQHDVTPVRHPGPHRERVVRGDVPVAHHAHRRGDRRELAEPDPRLVDEMRARGAEPTATERPVEPPARACGCPGRRRGARTGRAWRSAARRCVRRRWRGRARRDSVAQRNSCPTSAVTRARSAAATRSRASLVVRVNGFSQSTCRPARNAASAISLCVAGGVATVIASTSASTASRSVDDCATPARAARRAVRSASVPTSATTSKPAARSAGTWMRVPNPVPTTATRGARLARRGHQ